MRVDVSNYLNERAFSTLGFIEDLFGLVGNLGRVSRFVLLLNLPRILGFGSDMDLPKDTSFVSYLIKVN